VIACVGEITPLIVTRTYLSWGDGDYPSSATRWDVIQGVIGDWPASRGTCLPVTMSWQVNTLSDPFPGTGLWWLIRGRNVCNVGTYGTDSSGVERVNVACPGLAK